MHPRLDIAFFPPRSRLIRIHEMKYPLLPVAAALLFSTGLMVHAAKPGANPKQIEEYTRLQIFLDNANFGPGKIDGHDGVFLRKALRLYQEAQGQAIAAPEKPKAPPETAGMDLSSVDPVFIEYTVTKEDFDTVGTLPSGPAAQAKVKRLPYGSLVEAIAEKFHSDIDFIKALNPGQTVHLQAGSKVRVPNVKPFELSSVKGIEAGSEAKSLIANELAEATAEQGAQPPASPSDAAPAPGQLSIHIGIKESYLEVRVGEKLAAAFPVTVGSHQTVSPIGKWKVQAVAKLPNFRYDPEMLKHGERSSNYHVLPPGPNNPVGIMWIALNKKGIGIHGTNDPDSIGRSASHGCIRLANWDVVKLAELVKPGVPVTIE